MPSSLRPVLLSLAAAALLAGLTPSALALDAAQDSVRGQVYNVVRAQIDGHAYGLALTVERGVEQEPFTQLLITSNPAEWQSIQLHGGANVLAVGDVDGDGNDDVAIAHQLEGASCPVTAQGTVAQMPCGAVRVYDGLSLAGGELTPLAELDMAVLADTCQPTTASPSAIDLEDVTGDGRADLAVTQLSSLKGSCGVVHVIPGNRLSGTVGLDAACARFKGPVMRDQPHPDLFGSELGLFGGRYLAIGAPYADDPAGANVTGRIAVHDIRAACSAPSPVPASPDPVFTLYGEKFGALMGQDTAYSDGILWVASKSKVQGFTVPSFGLAKSFTFGRSFPLGIAGDLDGDNRQEIMVGPLVITPDGKPVLQMAIVAQDTFRAAVLGQDHIVASDRFGSRLWSLTDIWDPYLSIYAEKPRVQAGEVVTIRVAEAVFLLPDAGQLQWHVAGATVLETNATWVRVRAGGPGLLTVQATLEDTVATTRIPIDLPERNVLVTGPDAVQVGQPFTAHVHAPAGSGITWQAPGGAPENGAGTTIQTTFAKAGPHTIVVHVQLPDGTEGSTSLEVAVLQQSLLIDAPAAVDQGGSLAMAVRFPRSDQTYTWTLDGARSGTSTLNGPAPEAPVGGFGRLNLTVVAHDAQGVATAVGTAQVDVKNLPPLVRTLNAHSAQQFNGVEGQANVQDPGGDAVKLAWSVAGVDVSSNASFAVRLAKPGSVEVRLVATDEDGLSTTVVRSIQVVNPWTLVAKNGTKEATDPLGTEGAKKEGKSAPAPEAPLLTVLVLAAVAIRRRPR